MALFPVIASLRSNPAYAFYIEEKNQNDDNIPHRHFDRNTLIASGMCVVEKSVPPF